MQVSIQWFADSFQNDCQEWDLNHAHICGPERPLITLDRDKFFHLSMAP